MGEYTCTQASQTSSNVKPKTGRPWTNKRLKASTAQRWKRYAKIVEPTDNPLLAAQKVEKARNSYSAMLSEIAALNARGKRKLAREFGCWLLKHPVPKVARLYDAVFRKAIPIEHGAVWNSRRILREAKDLCLYSDAKEGVLYRIEEHPHGGEGRRVFLSGPKEYARQLIYSDVTRKLVQPHPQVFDRNGSVDAAAAWLLEQMPKHRFVATTDFPSCYYLVDRTSVVARLPLPRRATESIMFHPAKRARPGALKWANVETDQDYVDSVDALGEWELPERPNPYGFPIHAGDSLPSTLGAVGGVPKVDASLRKHGVMPGAATSPIAVECVLTPVIGLLEDAAAAVKVGLYADNLVILANDEGAIEAAMNALDQFAAGHFVYGSWVGEELRRRLHTAHVKHGAQWLGRRFYVRKGIAVQRCIDREYLDLQIEIRTRINEALSIGSLEKLKSIEKSIAGKQCAHPYDRKMFDVAAELLAEVGAAVYRVEQDARSNKTDFGVGHG